MEPITKRGEKTLREKQGSNCPRRPEDEWTRQLLAKPSASRSGILRPTTPSCSGLFGQRHVDFQSVHSAGKKEFNVVQENGFSASPSCTSRVELTENVDYTANDSDESTTTDQLQRATKKEFEGEGSLCHDACQRKELDRKQNQCSDKELSRQSRLPTDDVTLEQTLSNESCHRRGVRDKIFSSDSALVECEMTHSCNKPGLVSSSREAFPFGPGVPQRKPWPHYGERPNAGENCDITFAENSILEVQEKRQTGEKQHACSTRERTFPRKNNRLRHERTHTGEKLHRCIVCGKTFAEKRNLVGHCHLHTVESPHQCSVCGKMFTRKADLLTHEKIHTGEKPYQCTVCGKAFSAKGTLTRHNRLHTGEKPYQCSVCGKAFSRKGTLTRHNQVHTGEKPYQCSVCGKIYTRKGHLVVHERIHTGEKPYRCSVCGKNYRHRNSLLYHQRRHSKEKL